MKGWCRESGSGWPAMQGEPGGLNRPATAMYQGFPAIMTSLQVQALFAVSAIQGDL